MNKQKVKGTGFEREIVDLLGKHGIAAERARGSDGRALGMDQSVDIVARNMPVLGQVTIQAKRRKAVARYLLPTKECDMVLVRGDRGKTHVVMELEWLLEKLK